MINGYKFFEYEYSVHRITLKYSVMIEFHLFLWVTRLLNNLSKRNLTDTPEELP